ncbi:MAG: sugar phosphate isomerase/epimerase [Clostridiales bacterium]|jgi:sugar phosphate isomerase/epimerase|nr:sugar phosphate isomerase/epimerase [Clostridiales bacterium]
MKIGVRGHDFGKKQPRDLAELLRGFGLDAAQLAVPKAIEGIASYFDADENLLDEIKREFSANEIEISVLGCYIEPSLPDPQLRKEQISIFKRGIECAAALEAGVIGTETTKFSGSQRERERALGFLYESVEEMLEKADSIGVKAAIEPVWEHTLNTPELTEKLIRRYSQLGIIFDPVNLLNGENVHSQGEFWKRALDLFGERIDAVHIKDADYKSGRFSSCRLGEGIMEYSFIARWLSSNKPDAPLLREGVWPGSEAEEFSWMRKTFDAS